MNEGFFVSGTDTGVGKSVVSAALVAGLVDIGTRVDVMKPVQSGETIEVVSEVPPVTFDGLADDVLLWEASDRSVARDDIVMHRFTAPLAPSVAADQGEDGINIDQIIGSIRDRCADSFAVVEGVGGWRVWLDEENQVCDLARAASLPVLIVAANRLGAINHTVLTVDAILDDGLDVAGIVLNDRSPHPPSEEVGAMETNANEIAKRTGLPVWRFSYLDAMTVDTLRRAGRALLAQIGQTSGDRQSDMSRQQPDVPPTTESV